MRNATQSYSKNNQKWFVIEFCTLGFIGKLFRTKDLTVVIQFFLLFYNDKPGDWLLVDIINTIACNPEYSIEKCASEKKKAQIQYTPSLFQHAGYHSSLKGKLQPLKDKLF